MPLTTQSILRTDLPLEESNDMVNQALAELENIAKKEFDGRAFTIRDLVPSDLPGFTNEEFVETSGSDNAYATTTGGDDTAIADDTVLMIWGISIITPVVSPIITTLRISVGAALRAQLNVYGLWQIINTGSAAGEVSVPKIGYLLTPIGVTSRQKLKIEEFTITATTAYIPVYHGATAEINGKTIEA